MKLCPICGAMKRLDNFRTTCKSYRATYCRACESAIRNTKMQKMIRDVWPDSRDRICLSCSCSFWSYGKGNRRCNACKRDD